MIKVAEEGSEPSRSNPEKKILLALSIFITREWAAECNEHINVKLKKRKAVLSRKLAVEEQFRGWKLGHRLYIYCQTCRYIAIIHLFHRRVFFLYETALYQISICSKDLNLAPQTPTQHLAPFNPQKPFQNISGVLP